MRGVVWALSCVLCVAGCGDDAAADAGSDTSIADSSVDADSSADAADAADAAPTPTCESAEPGCVGACQIVYECLVESTQRDGLIGPLYTYGFRSPDWDDCSACTARCEADTSGDGDTARACFAAQYAASACGASPDPTQAANAINTCCAGRVDSPFCVQSCIGIVAAESDLLNALIPSCQELAVNELTEPTCVGACPTVSEATHIPVTTEATWRPRSFAVHTDGSFAVHGMVDSGSIDFGGGASLVAGSPTQFVAVFEADGTPRWARALSGGHPSVAAPFGQLVKFDDAGNVTAAGELFGTADLGAGELTSAGAADLLIAQWTPDGTLRWARAFGGTGADRAQGLYVDGTETTLYAEFTGTIDLGLGVLGSGDIDVLVARLDDTGTVVWARGYGGAGLDSALSIAGHTGGAYTITGAASTGIDFGAGPITSAGDQDGFIARFAADGALRWAHVFGGPTWDVAYQMAGHGDAVVVADYISSGTVDIGGTAITGYNQALLRVEGDGAVRWVNDNPVGTDFGFIVHAVSVHTDGRVDVSGFSGSPRADLGGGPHDAFPGPDLIPASYAADGSFRWSLRLGGPLAETHSYLTRLPSGQSILVGDMLDRIDYGPGDLIGDGRDLFVLRFEAD